MTTAISKFLTEAIFATLPVLCLLFESPACGATPFTRLDLPCSGEQLRFADVNGDGLYDLLSLRGSHLLVFLQKGGIGFSLKPQIDYPLPKTPAIVWPQMVRRTNRSDIFVLDGEGVSMLTYSYREASLVRQVIAEKRNFLTASHSEDAVFFPLAVDTGLETPLVLVPTDQSLELWRPRRNGGWQYAQTLDFRPLAWSEVMTEEHVYENVWTLNLSVGDCNGDGREDLVFRKWLPQEERQRFTVFLQSPKGGFLDKPTNEVVVNNTLFDWVCLQDVNGDHIPDLIHNTWTREPWIIGGMYSGKVIVRVLLADARGALPDQPTFTFRKSDWQRAVPLVDLDGDGCLDLVLGYYHWKGRDDIVRMTETKRVDMEMRVHFYDHKDGFRPKPDTLTTIGVFFENTGLGMDFSWINFLDEAIHFDGDFNGDGYRDMIYRSGKDELSVRFLKDRTQGFSPKADLTFRVPMENHVSLKIRDVNRDKVSDLIVVPEDKGKPVTLFLSVRSKQ